MATIQSIAAEIANYILLHRDEDIKDESGWTLAIVKRDADLSTFKVLPKRWIVERTFGWLLFWRILNRHHERKHDTAENSLRIAMTRNMLRHLTRKENAAKAA